MFDKTSGDIIALKYVLVYTLSYSSLLFCSSMISIRPLPAYQLRPPLFPFEMDSFVNGDTICILEEEPQTYKP
jgi:hypothetical protein